MFERVQLVFLQLIPFLAAIVFHEVAHGFVARRHGDRTAEEMGRLTLNPIPHIDPIGTILFPVLNMVTGMNIMFGWARPVPINYNRLKPYRSGLFLTALAGPMANVIFAVVSALFLVLFASYCPNDFYLYEPLTGMALVAIQINYALAIFNLIPLPPLDGSKMVESFLSFENARKFDRLQTYSFFILIGLLWTGAFNILSYPILFLSNGSIAFWRTLFHL